LESLIYKEQEQEVCFQNKNSECIDALLCGILKRQALDNILKILHEEPTKDQTSNTKQPDKKVS
jgi:hypothetical protein